MSLFHPQKISKGTVAEAVLMVETYFQHRGLNVEEHRLTEIGNHQIGWWLQEGSARVYIVVQESDDKSGAILRISSPIVFIPEQNREAFYRRLLDINSNLSSCSLATHENVVLVVEQIHTVGLVQEELDDLVWNTAYLADLLDNKLVEEFGVQMYTEIAAKNMAYRAAH